MKRLGRILAVGCFWSYVTIASAAEVPPWDAPAFSANPAALRAAVGKLSTPDNSDAEILLEETTIRYDEKGLQHRTSRRIFRCLTKDGVERLSSAEAAWAPWYQERPTIRARVIGGDDTVHTLDAASIAEVPVDQEQQVLTDRRLLRAPLPALSIGAIVEQETSLREVRPFSEGGSVNRVLLNGYWPTLHRRVIVEAPRGLNLRREVRCADAKATQSEKNGRLTFVFDYKPGKPLKTFESYTPPEDMQIPELVLSTGKSWANAAASYAALVDRQIDLQAVKGLVRAEIGKETKRAVVIPKLLAALHRLTRYTGLEFGEAAITPRSPRETLARRYGDCKDRAVLFVAMLRAADIPAYVALLNVEAWRETLPQHPGLDLFNHAIVYVPGKTPLWIDLTAEYCPYDRAPAYDRDRLALVASPDTRELMRVARSDYHDSGYSERYEYDFRQGNEARLGYRETSKGSYAAMLRGRYASGNKQDLRKWWKAFLRESFHTEDIRRIDYKFLDDVSQPMVVEIDADKAKIPLSKENESEIAISLQPNLAAGLPSVFRPTRKNDKSEESGRDKDEDAGDNGKRRTPLVLPSPHVNDIEYRIIPPPGYVVSTLPDLQSDELGPASITALFVKNDDGSVRAAFRLDTGPGRFTAAEVERVREYIAAHAEKDGAKGPRYKIVFKHAAAELLAAGKVKDAIIEHWCTIARHPDCAGEHFRYATTLLKIGLGEAARAEARKGVQLAPKSAASHLELARVLTYDLFGAPYGVTMDWAGAAEACRKAIELDSSDAAARFQYAILLEHDSEGCRYCPRRLDQAIEEYRRARKLAAYPEHVDLNLGVALLYADRADEVRELNVNTSSPLAMKSLLVAAVAASEGLDAADKKISQLADDPTQRPTILAMAGDYLNQGRFYPQARSVLERAASGVRLTPQLRAQLKKLETMRRFEIPLDPKKNPRDLVARVFRGFLCGDADSELRSVLPDAANGADFERLSDAMHEMLLPLGRHSQAHETPAKRFADGFARMSMSVDGNAASGYHVRLDAASPREDIWYIAPEKGECRLVCPEPQCARLGAVALEFLDAKKPDIAKKWLQWAYERHKQNVGWVDPFAGSPFGRIWWMGFVDAKPNLRLAAAALLSQSAHPEPAIAILAEERGRKDLDKKYMLQIDRALACAYLGAKKFSELLRVADTLQESSQTSIEVLEFKVNALYGLGRTAEACKLLQHELSGVDIQPERETRLATMIAECGDLETARDHFRALADRYPKSAVLRSTLGWLALLAGRAAIDQAAFDDAVFGVKGSPYPSASALNGLAAVCAERGHLAEALMMLRRSLDLREGRPASSDWYVLGRLAEQYGLREIALSLYRKVPPPQLSSALSIYGAAQTRIKAMGKQPGT